MSQQQPYQFMTKVDWAVLKFCVFLAGGAIALLILFVGVMILWPFLVAIGVLVVASLVARMMPYGEGRAYFVGTSWGLVLHYMVDFFLVWYAPHITLHFGGKFLFKLLIPLGVFAFGSYLNGARPNNFKDASLVAGVFLLVFTFIKPLPQPAAWSRPPQRAVSGITATAAPSQASATASYTPIFQSTSPQAPSPPTKQLSPWQKRVVTTGSSSDASERKTSGSFSSSNNLSPTNPFYNNRDESRHSSQNSQVNRHISSAEVQPKKSMIAAPTEFHGLFLVIEKTGGEEQQLFAFTEILDGGKIKAHRLVRDEEVTLTHLVSTPDSLFLGLEGRLLHAKRDPHLDKREEGLTVYSGTREEGDGTTINFYLTPMRRSDIIKSLRSLGYSEFRTVGIDPTKKDD